MSEAVRKEAIRELWRRCNLRYLLRPIQKKAYDYIRTEGSLRIVLAFHRGGGKSFYSAVEAVEAGISGKHVVAIAPSAKMARNILGPHIRTVLQDCPEDMRPKFRYVDGRFEFPSGGTITIAGSEASSDAVRGIDIDLCILDECGFYSDADYLEKSVILPRLLPRNGRIIYPSTPAKSASHPYSNLMRQAEAEGYILKLRVYDNPDIGEDLLQSFIEEAGGENTTSFRREYLCEIVTDKTFAVVPEADKLRVAELEIEDEDARYVSVRFQVQKLSGVLGARVTGGTMYVDQERVFPGANTDDIAKAVKEVEAAWPASDTIVFRHTDGGKPFIHDLSVNHRTAISGLFSSDTDADIGMLRTMIERGTLVCHPRCTTTIRHLQDAVWNDTKKSFDTSGDSGNFDLVLACAYLARSMRRVSDTPETDRSAGDTFFRRPEPKPANTFFAPEFLKNGRQ